MYHHKAMMPIWKGPNPAGTLTEFEAMLICQNIMKSSAG